MLAMQNKKTVMAPKLFENKKKVQNLHARESEKIVLDCLNVLARFDARNTLLALD